MDRLRCAPETIARPKSSSHRDVLSTTSAFSVLLTVLGLPLAYVVAVAVLLLKRRGADVGISLVVAGITIAAGSWAILQSRASTAGIGFVFLPTLAALAGGLALAYGASRRARSGVIRLLGATALLAAGAPAALALRDGVKTIARNAHRDEEQAHRDSALVRHRARLDTLLATSGERADDTLEAELRAHGDDRELVLAALERSQISPALLDSFAHSPDLGIALQAVRNPRTTSTTLASIYRTHPNRTYFLQALAGHANAPPSVLREIRALRPAPITGLDIWFAGNPSTPADVLRDVARTSESIDAVRTLLHHPALDCAMIDDATRGPAVRGHPDDRNIAERLTEQRAARCH
jgi:hypothetical protein